MNNTKEVIIIGGNHHNTLGVVRSLGRKGIMSLVIITSKEKSSFVLKSRYVKRGCIVDDSNDAIRMLFSLKDSFNEKPVLIACHDIISSLIDQNKNSLSPFYLLPGCEQQGRVTCFMNKKTMSELATKNGLLVPESVVINSGTIINEIKPISFPCITKPIESRLGCKSEIQKCQNKDQLLEAIMDGKNYIVQKFIDKDIEFQFIGCSIYGGKDIVIPGKTIILRQPLTTNTGFLYYSSLDGSFDKTLKNTKAFIREIGYSGLFSVEFLRDKNGEDFFMEINFRNDGNAISVTNAGVNLPYIWYLACQGEEYGDEIKQINDGYVMPEFMELSLYLNGSISMSQLKDDMKKATSFMDYDSDDPAPTRGWREYKKRKRRIEIKRGIKILLNK